MPRGYTQATAATHHTWYPPTKKNVSPLFPSHLTSPLHTHPAALQKNLAPQGHLDKFFFFFSSFSFSSLTGAGKRHSQHHCHLLPSRARRPPPLAPHHITHSTQANLPPHGPVTHATHRPRRAQPGVRHYPDYIASTSTQPPVATTTSATSIPPPRHPLRACQPSRCTHPHTRRRHTLALPPSN